MRTPILLASVSVLLTFAAPPARADAIDGNWCHPEAGRLEILGPQITTPGGNRITGDYDRHGFRHVVPAEEPGAGANVDMVLVDDDTLHRMVAPGPGAATEVWRRCAAPVS